MSSTKDSTGLYTVREAADYLGVAVGTLRVWCHKRLDGLKFIKLGGTAVRFRKEDLDAFVARGEVTAISDVAMGASEAAE